MARGALAAVVASAALLVTAPDSVATPVFPDVDSLIDDSGPLPDSVSELPRLPAVAFVTDSGLVCRARQGKLTHEINCAGDIPGAPPDAGAVQLPGVYGKSSVPARFVPTPPEDPSDGASPTVRLPVGHKIAFWDLSPAQSMVCGTPPSTDVVCVLKEPQVARSVYNGPVATHGFVIAVPQSWVF